MNEFYIYERFKVNDVEAARVIPLNASQISMIKKPWGVTINDKEYAGHVELRTMLGNVVDSHSGKYADYNTYQDFTLSLLGYELIGVYCYGHDCSFIYVQYKHIETNVPLLLRYDTVNESPIEINEYRDDRWGNVERVSYARYFGDLSDHYAEDVQVPLMKGIYVETERHEDTFLIAKGHTCWSDIKTKAGEVTIPYLKPQKVVQLEDGLTTYKIVEKTGDSTGWMTYNANGEDINHFRFSRDDLFALLLHGVKSITNSK